MSYFGNVRLILGLATRPLALEAAVCGVKHCAFQSGVYNSSLQQAPSSNEDAVVMYT